MSSRTEAGRKRHGVKLKNKIPTTTTNVSSSTTNLRLDKKKDLSKQ
jgi:hypothetical protein